MPMKSSPDLTGLLTESEVLGHFRNITAKKFGQLRRAKQIPYVRLGRRSYLYDLAAVRRALNRLAVTELD
jgi:hypothetical protein